MPRFFSDDSFWNTPIDPDPEIDPRNDHFIELLYGQYGGPLYINLHEWTIPVYEADASTPRRTIFEPPPDPAQSRQRLIGKSRSARGPGFEPNVPIPDDARPVPQPVGHLAVVDWSTNTAWEMWGRRREDGEWESGNGMTYSLTGSGVWKAEDFPNLKDGDSLHNHGPNLASGVPVIAGLIMHDEVKQGHIRHKLAFGTYYSALKEFTSPAAWSDGFEPGGLPRGAVLQLDPALDPARFPLSPGGKVVFRALQEYGMVNIAFAHGNALYGQWLDDHRSKSWTGLLRGDEFYQMPLEHFRVLKLGPITRMGDSPRKI